MICFPDESPCCAQWQAADILLTRVFRSQAYWNSDLVLPWYGATTDTWFHVQFHLICQRDAHGNQTFVLRWFDEVSARQCQPAAGGPPFELTEWTLISQDCDPVILTFRVENISETACYPDGLKDPDDPIAICDFQAIVTE